MDINQIVDGVYSISINGKLVYVGEAVKPYQRFLVHGYSIFFYHNEWGLNEENFAQAKIEVKVIEERCANRKSAERKWINELKPLFQIGGDGDNYDNVISSKDDKHNLLFSAETL